jgi:hypothetical protein
MIQWIGLRENLQETIDFPIKYRAFLQIFPSSNPLNGCKGISPQNMAKNMVLTYLHFRILEISKIEFLDN